MQPACTVALGARVSSSHLQLHDVTAGWRADQASSDILCLGIHAADIAGVFVVVHNVVMVHAGWQRQCRCGGPQGSMGSSSASASQARSRSCQHWSIIGRTDQRQPFQCASCGRIRESNKFVCRSLQHRTGPIPGEGSTRCVPTPELIATASPEWVCGRTDQNSPRLQALEAGLEGLRPSAARPQRV